MAKIVALDHVQVAMPRAQEAAARKFYGELLGLVEIPKPQSLSARGGLWYRCGKLQLHLGVEDGFRPAKKAHPAFIVDDLDGVVVALKARNALVVFDAPQLAEGRRVFTEDPFGNRIELIQRADAD